MIQTEVIVQGAKVQIFTDPSSDEDISLDLFASIAIPVNGASCAGTSIIYKKRSRKRNDRQWLHQHKKNAQRATLYVK